MSGLEETRRVSFDAWIVMDGQRIRHGEHGIMMGRACACSAARSGRPQSKHRMVCGGRLNDANEGGIIFLWYLARLKGGAPRLHLFCSRLAALWLYLDNLSGGQGVNSVHATEPRPLQPHLPAAGKRLLKRDNYSKEAKHEPVSLCKSYGLQKRPNKG